MDELQEMREQMAALKEKLNKQEIVNEKNLCAMLKEKVNNWRAFMIIGMILSPFLIISMFFLDTHTHIGTIGYSVLLLMSFGVALKSIRSLKKKDVMAGKLKDVLPVLYQLRKREKGPHWLIAMGCFIAINALETIVTLYKKGVEFGPKAFSFLAVVLGLFIFVWLCWKFIIRRQSSQWDEYIRQIEEMSDLDEENDKAESETKN